MELHYFTKPLHNGIRVVHRYKYGIGPHASTAVSLEKSCGSLGLYLFPLGQHRKLVPRAPESPKSTLNLISEPQHETAHSYNFEYISNLVLSENTISCCGSGIRTMVGSAESTEPVLRRGHTQYILNIYGFEDKHSTQSCIGSTLEDKHSFGCNHTGYISF